jgi:hypothetical protein
MTTTVMRDSIVGDDWIARTAQAVPIQKVIDPETQQPTGDFLTGPVRLMFPTLFHLPQPTEKSPNPKYGATLLFTPYADFTLFYEEYYTIAGREFPDAYNASTGQYYGLHSPFRDQGEKAKFNGFTPGCTFVNASTQFKPPIVDAQSNPVLDESRAYPGVWAVCAVNMYAFKDPRKKGISFGLQSVMLIGDDQQAGGGGADPNTMFGGVKGAIQAPTVTAAHMQGMPQGAQPPAAPGMPAPPPGGTYAPPAAPGMPGQPPAAPAAPVMPGQPVADPRGPVPAGFSSWAEYDELMG